MLQSAFPISDQSQVGQARRAAAELAAAGGMSDVQIGRASIIASELATNLLKFGVAGTLFARARRDPEGIEILAVDKGPGMTSVGDCLSDGYSTSGTSGNGLGAVRRQADVFDIWSDVRGTAIVAQVLLPPARAADNAPGLLCQALHGETACGDAWCVQRDENRFSVLLVDGLGHGVDASIAAHAALRVFDQPVRRSPRETIDAMHTAMGGTRGGAVGIASGDYRTGVLSYCGIGNISGFIVGTTRTRGLLNHNGIVGGAIFRAQQFEYAWDEPSLLVLHSDGLQTRWRLDDYPGLARRHPSLIAAILHRDFCRGRDDVTVLVLPLPAPQPRH